MVRHEDVTGEKKPAASTNPHNSASQGLEVHLRQLGSHWQQVAGDEEGLPGHLQSPQPRHSVSVAQGSICNPAAFPFRSVRYRPGPTLGSISQEL